MGTLYRRLSGSPDELGELQYRVGGAPATIAEIYERQTGSPVLIWQRTTINLDGHSIIDIPSTAPAKAGVYINADGTVDSYTESAGLNQIDVATDWIIPNGDADSSYDVRITNVVWTQGSSFDVEAAAEDVWISLAFNRGWEIHDLVLNGPWKDVDFDIQIRKDGGAPLTTGSYNLVAWATNE
jgi:hypothetical protein